MRSEIFVLISLISTAGLVTAVLAIAWRCFGRPTYAATWAWGFAVTSLQFLLVLVGYTIPPLKEVTQLAYAFAATLAMALIAIGYRQRVGLPPRTALVLGSALAAAIAGAATILSLPHPNFNTAPQMLIASAFLGLSAVTMVEERRRATEAERSAIVVLGLFGLFNFVAALLALARVVTRDAELIAVQQLVTQLGMPIGFTALGLFSVFLLAADLAETMRRLATVDALTGILNRRGLEQAAEVAIANAKRHSRPLAVVAADLDRFKSINDTHGHAAGDRVLQRFAEHVEAAVRRGDLVGRIGGEEFAFLLVSTPRSAAAEVTDRIRVGLGELTTEMPGNVPLTCSFGIAMLEEGDETLGPVLARADRALYRSKLSGRDCITVDGEAPEPVFA